MQANDNPNNVHHIDDYRQYAVSELICIKCFFRGVVKFPVGAKLKNLSCVCGATGTIIGTGCGVVVEGFDNAE